MVFDDGRQHFFRYQKASEASSNPSTPTRMSAYVTGASTARLPSRGDVIWVLARQDETSPARYRFAYAFVVDEMPVSGASEKRFFGSKGLWLEDSELVSKLPWFKAFFLEMGNGGTSIRVIGDNWLKELRVLFRSEIGGDNGAPSDLEAEARASGWPEDVVRYGAISARRGQADFRNRLLEAYGARCCISGCRVAALLEAAHIRPHSVEPNYATRNGLLLRADLHTLFDLHLLAVDEFGRVHLSPEVVDLYYRDLVNRVQRIPQPTKGIDRPSEEDLRARMALFKKTALN